MEAFGASQSAARGEYEHAGAGGGDSRTGRADSALPSMWEVTQPQWLASTTPHVRTVLKALCIVLWMARA